MKKRNIILTILAVLLLQACGNSKDSEQQEVTQQSNNKPLVLQLDQEAFEEKICDLDLSDGKFHYKGNRPCVIDFYAVWCGPCKRQAPILEELAKEYGDKVDFYKVDVDEAQKVAAAFHIRSIPTLIICPSTGQAMVLQGLQDKETLATLLESFL